MSYRQIGKGDFIQDGDEFLNDDCETWSLISKSNEYAWVIGTECTGNLKPFRRNIRPASSRNITGNPRP